jgi:DNA adenine methylase
MVVNRSSFSGILIGGAIGGTKQQSKWSVDCRFKPARLEKQHRQVRERVKGSTVVVGDFEQTLLANDGFAVCDPPYIEKGGILYHEKMAKEDHVRLASILKTRQNGFLVTYDNHDLVYELYSDWATIQQLDAKYSILGTGRISWDKKIELVVHYKPV